MASDYYNENGSAPRENFSCSSDARFCHRLCLRLWHSRRDFLLSTQHCKVEPASPLNDAPSRRTVAGPGSLRLHFCSTDWHKKIREHERQFLLRDCSCPNDDTAQRSDNRPALWHYAESTATQVPPVPDLRGDRLCSGSKLPIANLVTGITMRTRKLCDPAFTAAEPRPLVLGCA